MLFHTAHRNLRQMRTDVAEQIREAGTGLSKPTIPPSLAHPQPSGASTHSGSRRSATPTGSVGMPHVGPQHQQQGQLQGQQPQRQGQQQEQQQQQQGQEQQGQQQGEGQQQQQGQQQQKQQEEGQQQQQRQQQAVSQSLRAQRLSRPSQLSPWERLRRAANVLSHAQFKTCDWANEGDADDFVQPQVRN